MARTPVFAAALPSALQATSEPTSGQRTARSADDFGNRHGGSVYDWNDPFARMFLQILAVITEFEANLIRQRTREGMAIARQNGKLRGKQPSLKPAQDREIRRMHDTGDYNVAEIAGLFGVSRPPCTGPWSARRSFPPLPADTRPEPDVAKYDKRLTRPA